MSPTRNSPVTSGATSFPSVRASDSASEFTVTLSPLAHRSVASPRLAAAIAALPVDAHARRGDELAHRLLRERLEQHRGAERVGRGVLRHLVHRLAHPHPRSEMNDRVDPLERTL